MIIGGLDDQINMIVWSMISKPFFSFNNEIYYNSQVLRETLSTYLNPSYSNEPFIWSLISVFGSLLGKNFNNIYVFTITLINLLGSYFYFRKFKYGFIYTVLFVFSAFTWVHMGKHPDLMPIFFLPIIAHFLDSLEFGFSRKGILGISFLLIIWSLTSNYLGYFGVVFVVSYLMVEFIQKKINATTLLKSIVFCLATYAIAIGIILFPYIKINYLNVRMPGYIAPVGRSYDDLVGFSSRPWYHLIPSPKNPIYSDFSKFLISRLQATKYFLADDYFQGEHDSMFFGYSFIILFIVVSVLSSKFNDTRTFLRHRRYLVVAIVLFILSLPPFFSIGGRMFYTPIYFLFKLVPLFRVTARLSIFILFSLLVSLAYGLENIRWKNTLSRKLFLLLFMIVTLAETFVPVKIFRDTEVPDVYSYLGSQEGLDKLVVCPYNKVTEAFYYLPTHRKDLVNVRGYKNDFYESETLTKGMGVNIDADKLRKIGVRYLVIYKTDSGKDFDIVGETSGLVLEREFADFLLYTIEKK